MKLNTPLLPVERFVDGDSMMISMGLMSKPSMGVSKPRGDKKEIVKYFKKLYSADKSICLRLQDFEGNGLWGLSGSCTQLISKNAFVNKIII